MKNKLLLSMLLGALVFCVFGISSISALVPSWGGLDYAVANSLSTCSAFPSVVVSTSSVNNCVASPCGGSIATPYLYGSGLYGTKLYGVGLYGAGINTLQIGSIGGYGPSVAHF